MHTEIQTHSHPDDSESEISRVVTAWCITLGSMKTTNIKQTL